MNVAGYVALLADEQVAAPVECDRCPARVRRTFRVRVGAQEETLCWGCWNWARRAYGLEVDG